ncbi:hypothetical protein LCGC14_0496640 [marine sediment metagenome]|uniref:Uncharacterized protein n=1 Tax=marine sediment metagenome TaxID=412755 RepID=A0A0F9SNH7_9ZZZZ
MYGRPLIYELDSYNTNLSAYGPYIWTYGLTNEQGEVKFDVSMDYDYLQDFLDIFGSVEGINSLEDVVLYLRAFTGDFDWDDLAIDTPDQYLASRNGTVYDGSTKLTNYNTTRLKLQDNTYVEGLIYLGKNHIAAATNDYFTYTIPDPDIGAQFEPLTIHLYVTEANPIPNGQAHTSETISAIRDIKDLEPTSQSVFDDDYRYYANIDFINPSGNVAKTFYKELHEGYNSGYFTIDNETMLSIVNDAGPGVSSIKIQVAESEYYKASPPIFVPVEIKGPNWVKFGEKNTKIDLIDPFINAYGGAFDGDIFAPFESSYDHLIGTLWIDPDFLNSGENSTQDYVEINLEATIIDEFGEEQSFPLREGIMLLPVNLDGLMMFDVGLAEDSFLQGLNPKINLSFDISYNAYDIFNDSRDVDIYLLDLRFEKNPSSNTPNTTWSVYENGWDTQGLGFSIFKASEGIFINTGTVSMGGTEAVDGADYGLEVEYTYDPEISEYYIDSESELLTLLEIESITPLVILNETSTKVTDWTQPYPSSTIMQNQSLIRFGSNPNINNFTSFTVVYKFDFNFGTKKYAKISMGPSLTTNLNVSWVEFELDSGFLPDMGDSSTPLFVRYNQTIIGTNSAGPYSLDYGIDNDNIDQWDDKYFIIYNSSKPIASKNAQNGIPDITFSSSLATDEKAYIIYGIRSQYELGYGFQKVGKSASDSIKLISTNTNKDKIKGTSAISALTLEDPSLYIGLDNSSQETVLELYNIPLLWGPELNLTFKLDPIVVDQISNFPSETNELLINFYYVSQEGYGSYYSDALKVHLNYTDIQPDLESGSYSIYYNKDLQGIYEAFGTGSFDIYISISQINNDSNYIPYVILEQFDYLCDEHFSEMYARQPLDSSGNLDVAAVINTPHFVQLLSRPFIDEFYGESPFDLLNNSQVTISVEDMPYSSLVSLDGVSGDYSFGYLGTMETLDVSPENFYMIPNMGLFTDVYDTEKIIYQDGSVNLYYGSGVETDGAFDYDKRIYMDYENSSIDDYESVISSGVATSWEDTFNITDQFLTTQDITVSGSVLYHQLFDLTNDIIDIDTLEGILGNITGAYFGIQLPDRVSVAHIRTVGTPYVYDLSIQGFPVGDYIDSTSYCNVITSGTSYNFDTRIDSQIMNNTNDISLEFASNGSKYIVFYISEQNAQNYAQNNKVMVDYWAYHTFTEGFDYDISEDPEDPFVTIIDWSYGINSLTSFDMHPDFSLSSSFIVDFSALEWDSVDNNYIQDGVDEITFKPSISTDISSYYYGDANESFSILNIIPDNQFNDTSIFRDIYVEIWDGSDESTTELFSMNDNPIMYGYIFQDVNISFYYWINYTKVAEDLAFKKPEYILVSDSYSFIKVNFVSDQLKYKLGHTPFNYDYLGAGNNAYHITLTVEGQAPIYSYDTTEFNKFVLKIKDNYIYFQDRNFTEAGYISNQTKITISYKFKLQPGLLSEEHFLQIIYPWTNVFETESSYGASDDGTIMYRESYKKLSGSSIISPFEYSLSINDTYSLYLSYRLNYRESYEEKFTIDYSTTLLDFYYMDDDFAQYVSEFSEQSVFIYYYDEFGKQQIMDRNDYNVDTNLHKITLKDNGNTLVTPNPISEFYVSYAASPLDYQVLTHKYYYYYQDELTISDTLNVRNWEVLNGEQHDIIPNFNAYYFDEPVEGNSFPFYNGEASQLSAFLEPNEELIYKLSWALDPDIYNAIKQGDYTSLYINTIFDNYECLDKLTVELYNGTGIMEGFTQIFTIDDLLRWNFNLKIDLPTTTNTLWKIHIIPEFRSDDEYSANNDIGVPEFEFLEWSDNNGEPLLFMNHMLENILFTETALPETVYLFNEKLQYLALPEGVLITWTIEQDQFGQDTYIIQIPNAYLDPSNKSIVKTFSDGDTILIRYNSPVEKAVNIGIEKLYFNKKPYDYANLPSIAEIKLIDTEDIYNYQNFTAPYSYNITLPLTPFNTEYLGTYMEALIDINLTTLQQFATDGYIDFSHLVLSVPNPGYELTVFEIAVIQESAQPSGVVESFNDRVWQYTERENFTSSPTPENDEYVPILLETPLFYNDADQGKWLDYLKIYDDNYNYYSAGISGDDYQLHYNTTSGKFTWNSNFNKFQEYWGMEIQLPALISPNTTLYFEYCTNDSWSADIILRSANINIDSLDLIYNLDYLLDPHYETWYDEIIQNSNYDFNTVQFYSESFKVYDNSSTASYMFETIFDFTTDFVNLSLYEVVATYPNFTFNILKNDSVNYNIDFDINTKNVTITDLIAGDGVLNQFDEIVIVLNFTSGPISDKTRISLSPYFNQTYLVDREATFYDYISFDFERHSYEPSYLFAEDSQTIISDYTSFESIDYSSNVHLSSELQLRDFDTSLSYTNFETFENPYNTIYEADLDFDGEVDYKQEIDIDKDGTIDITKFGIKDPEVEGEFLWYRIIQDFISEEKTHSVDYNPIQMTDWFYLDRTASLFEVHGHYTFARRTSEETVYRYQTTQTRSYSITLDNDLDGYADSYIEYKKVIDNVDTRIESTESTSLVRMWKDDIPSGDFMFKYKAKPTRWKKYVLNRELTPDAIESRDYSQLPYSDKISLKVQQLIYNSYTRVEETSTTEITDQSIQETVTYTDFEEGEPVSVRTYLDSFPSESYKNFRPFKKAVKNMKWAGRSFRVIIITEVKQYEIDTLPFLIIDPQQLNWSTETWGVDSVPLKYDTVYTNTFNGEIDIENIYETTITFNLKNRYSLYSDYLKEDIRQDNFVGDTTFTAKGVLITPKDGLVYYTSDKYAYQSQGHDEAKMEGHLFYYDSDLNGFYETVYVLAPDHDSDGVYDVVSIGYNYDGKHEFAPYKLTKPWSRFADSITTRIYSREITYRGSIYTRSLKSSGIQGILDYLEDHFPGAKTDDFIPRDTIFEIDLIFLML